MQSITEIFYAVTQELAGAKCAGGAQAFQRQRPSIWAYLATPCFQTNFIAMLDHVGTHVDAFRRASADMGHIANPQCT